MHRLALLRLTRRPANDSSRLATRWVAAFQMLLGVLLIWADHRRFAAPVYETIRDSPGNVDSWGFASVAFAGLIVGGVLAGSYWLKFVGIVLCSAWNAVFGYATVQTAFNDPMASPLGVVFIGWAGVMCFLLAYDERLP